MRVGIRSRRKAARDPPLDPHFDSAPQIAGICLIIVRQIIEAALIEKLLPAGAELMLVHFEVAPVLTDTDKL
jgi:hypothetical protein